MPGWQRQARDCVTYIIPSTFLFLDLSMQALPVFILSASGVSFSANMSVFNACF